MFFVKLLLFLSNFLMKLLLLLCNFLKNCYVLHAIFLKTAMFFKQNVYFCSVEKL